MKQYISPFIQLGLEGDGVALDRESVNLAKKKLLADIELSASHSIKRGKREMTKDDVLKAFDNLPAKEDWDYHRLVGRDVVLMRFLEENTFKIGDKFGEFAEYEQEDFLDFVSPYFANSFSIAVVDCLEKRHHERMDGLVYGNSVLLTEYDSEEAWSEVELYLNRKIEALEALTERAQKKMVIGNEELVQYYNDDMMKCLNLLPDGDFDWLRNHYAVTMFNFSANAWNAGNKKQAVNFVDQAQKLIVGEYERDLLAERAAFFVEQSKGTGAGGTGMSWGTILWIVFILIRLIAAFLK
jgi:hypothetical protein